MESGIFMNESLIDFRYGFNNGVVFHPRVHSFTPESGLGLRSPRPGSRRGPRCVSGLRGGDCAVAVSGGLA